MKGFTKSPFNANKAARSGAAPLPQHDIQNPFEDEEVLEEIIAHQSSATRDPQPEEEDLVLDDDYDQPAPPPKPKKKVVKKKKPASASASFSNTTELTAPQYSQPIQSSPTAFDLPPDTSTSTASATTAASAPAKKYLNNVTSYFNEKKEQFNRSRSSTTNDPELNPTGSIDDFALREAALKRREAEILAQEQKVAERERQVKQFEGHINNWPFKWWAILYHNIPDDILPENQRFIRAFYYLWMFELFCFGWQFIAIVTDVLDGACSASILTIVWNALFCCAGLFGSWFLWYKVIYDASKKSAISSIKYGRFTCGFFMHWGWCIIMLSGVWASDGILGLIQTVTGGCTASSIFFVVGTVAWGLNLLWSSYMSKLAYNKYKAAGGTFSSMRSEFTKEAAKAALSRA